MRKWVVWCLTNNLSFVVYIVLILSIPLYVLVYIPEGLKDWSRDFRLLKSEHKKIKSITP